MTRRIRLLGGICGFISKNEIGVETLKKMNYSMIHRGPDNSGEEIFFASGVYIGMAQRRLDIIDLTKQGHPPIHSCDKSISIVFNGEIYNFGEIKAQLDYPFIWGCDSEIIIAAYLKWGINCISQFKGTFSFALYDRRDDKLYLVRDRIGEKPLYYGNIGDSFVFASELKALKLFPDFNSEINRDTLALFTKYNYIPAPYSIYKNIYKLMPGNYAMIQADRRNLPQVKPYWDFISHCIPVERTEKEVVNEIENLLIAAVRRQMMTDVPFGAFLSGGVDSSLITALMQSISSFSINTYTIGFHELDFNEAEYAKKVAEHLGTNHTQCYISPKEAMDVIPKLPHLYDEPFADSSQIPTYLVSQLAKKDVKVILTGDGGDELFCGYESYYRLYSFYKKIKLFPFWFRKFSGHILCSLPLSIVKEITRIVMPGIKDMSLRRGANVLVHSNTLLEMAHASRRFGYAGEIVLEASAIPTIWNQPQRFANIYDFYKLMMAVDVLQSLPDGMCVKTDRAAMGCSLENKAPLMDSSIVEYSATIPGTFMMKNGPKWILKEILYKHIPKELIERPKMGFGIPIGEWIRNPLRPWAEDLLSTVKVESFFKPKKVQKLWDSHIKRNKDNTTALWGILMFQAWLKENKNAVPPL